MIENAPLPIRILGYCLLMIARFVELIFKMKGKE